jgi:hypothetical protein
VTPNEIIELLSSAGLEVCDDRISHRVVHLSLGKKKGRSMTSGRMSYS